MNKLRMCKNKLVTRNGVKYIAELTKSPSKRYKLSVCIKGSCTICNEADVCNFTPGCLKKKKKKEREFAEFDPDHLCTRLVSLLCLGHTYGWEK